MANWKHVIDISFLEDALWEEEDQTDEQASRFAQQVADELSENDVIIPAFYIQNFRNVRSVEAFDVCLEELYDWAD